MIKESLLEYDIDRIKLLRRCKKCLLPETFPFIEYDDFGVCNYCHNHKLRSTSRPKKELSNIIKPYRRENGNECIVPFSGGRDSCYGLHLVVNELKMRPITYTYDWGMITPLGYNNATQICNKLGVERIIVKADIAKKIRNISINLKAWLKSPALGMVSILTAGDKHFFQHIERIKKLTNIKLNLWSFNPFEVTYFKAGFLGVKPKFKEKEIYSLGGIRKQLNYQCLRLMAMIKNPRYFNKSLWDTLSGEYYRSFAEKKDCYHIFDYWLWDEKIVESTLDSYNWERAEDTNATWRVGDGTAALYNYIYFTVAGFTEHDTFRSNQIREGEITRKRALKLIEEENRPRFQSLRWYFNILEIDFNSTIKKINKIPKLYN